ncbi:alpha/beta hydrolase family protein [Micrococcus luteus]|uniref:alpha/beta hydrolase family protein n=1 Tax=Micrococcus luteus TaxID=1270 RepID=UPI0015D7BC6F|nr:alpha/beta fold hydrolase [Micrococcus luteus]
MVSVRERRSQRTQELPDLPDAAPVRLEFDDVRLGGYAWWGGQEAPAVLLLHGWGEDASTMAPVARQVRARGWHAVSISLRGWPGSTGVDDYGGSAAVDVGRVLDWMRGRPRVRDVVLLGLSMGGLMAALAAADQADGSLRGLVLVNAPADLPSFARDTAFGGVRRYLETTLQGEQWHDSSPLAHAHRLVHPMLIVTGETDTMIPPDQGRRLADVVAGAVLLEVTGMGHHPTPDEWARVVSAAGAQFGLEGGSGRTAR